MRNVYHHWGGGGHDDLHKTNHSNILVIEYPLKRSISRYDKYGSKDLLQRSAIELPQKRASGARSRCIVLYAFYLIGYSAL